MPFDLAEVIEHQVRRGFENVVSKMILICDRRIAAQETKERLLQEVVRGRGVACHPKDVGPQPSGCLSVEGFEFRLVHWPLRRSLKRHRCEYERCRQSQSIGGHEITGSRLDSCP